MTYGLILCAGKQSRFEVKLPKALVEINGETLLQKNINVMSKFCDKIYVVCSFENQHYFNGVDKIVIESGKGSGDAVWQSLEKLEIKKNDKCFVLWGDSYQTQQIYSTLSNSLGNYEAVIPCVREDSPYVQIKQISENKVKVNFSKFGEEITPGLHDLSLFHCKASELLGYLREFRNLHLEKNGTYSHKHGNEMEFLDVFNETMIKTKCVEFENYKDFSFNTLKQLKEMMGEDKISVEQ